MDAEEVKDIVLEVAIGYAGSIGTSLWSKITEDRAQVVWLSSSSFRLRLMSGVD